VTELLRKFFRERRSIAWAILEKEVVDEIIYKTVNLRDRLLLELMARGGMRINEVLKLTVNDVDDRKLILHNPKSGKETEVVYIPAKVADRLTEYLRSKHIAPEQRIFPITYSTARAIVKQAGRVVGIVLKAHDLRRHAATYASRAGIPIEIVSKVILRHANLSTTQRYLGKVSDTEAVRWIDNLYA
jgi:integrase/recombinase XerD